MSCKVTGTTRIPTRFHFKDLNLSVTFGKKKTQKFSLKMGSSFSLAYFHTTSKELRPRASKKKGYFWKWRQTQIYKERRKSRVLRECLCHLFRHKRIQWHLLPPMKNRLTFPKEAPEMKSSGSLPSLASVSSSSLRTVDAPITRDQFEQHHTNHFKKSQIKGANRRGTRTDPKTPLKNVLRLRREKWGTMLWLWVSRRCFNLSRWKSVLVRKPVAKPVSKPVLKSVMTTPSVPKTQQKNNSQNENRAEV